MKCLPLCFLGAHNVQLKVIFFFTSFGRRVVRYRRGRRWITLRKIRNRIQLRVGVRWRGVTIRRRGLMVRYKKGLRPVKITRGKVRWLRKRRWRILKPLQRIHRYIRRLRRGRIRRRRRKRRRRRRRSRRRQRRRKKRRRRRRKRRRRRRRRRRRQRRRRRRRCVMRFRYRGRWRKVYRFGRRLVTRRRRGYRTVRYVCMYVNLYLNTGNHQLSLS